MENVSIDISSLNVFDDGRILATTLLVMDFMHRVLFFQVSSHKTYKSRQLKDMETPILLDRAGQAIHGLRT